MKRHTPPILLLAFAFVLGSSSLRAQRGTSGARAPGNAQIDVQVRYADGRPGPPGIHVVLESAEGGAGADCQTVDGGKCQFRPNAGGIYLVRVNERGYEEASVRVELVGNMKGFANLDLKPMPGQVLPDASASLSGDSVSAAELSIPVNARQEFEKGQSALKENKLDAGISHLRKAIKLYENYPLAYTLLGTAYLEQKNWKDAETALVKATSLDSRSGEAYLALGAVFNQTKNYPRAETALLRGLEVNPDAPGGHYELAKTYWALGRWQEAAPHARKAVADMPDLASPHVLMGNILLKENNPKAALHEYQEYLRLDPNGPMAQGVRQMIEKLQKAPIPRE